MNILTVYSQTKIPIIMATTVYHLVNLVYWSCDSRDSSHRSVNNTLTHDKIIQQSIKDMDVTFKLQLIRSLIADHCVSHLRIFPEMSDTDSDGFVTVVGTNMGDIDISHDLPHSVSTVVCKISEVYTEIQMVISDTATKIHTYNNSILRHFSKLDLSTEISDIGRLSKLLDARLALFIDVHKIISHIK